MKQTLRNGILAMAAAGLLAGAAHAANVAGKIVSVSHEKVNVNNVWLDKISVTVDSCDAPGTLVTVQYSPATTSDRAALGHLFDQNITSARTADLKAQQMPNGYGVFWVDANNRVLRTGLLGSPLNCSHVQKIIQQFP